MKLSRISRSERVDRCPICQKEVSEIGFTHINMEGGHIRTNTSKCNHCDVRLIERNGQWKTSWLDWTDLKKPVDIEGAYLVMRVQEMNRHDCAKFYDMAIEEYNEMLEREWSDFTKGTRLTDITYLWQTKTEYGFAWTRDGFILKSINFFRV